MAIQLTNRMGSMNEYYKIESRFIFDTAFKALENLTEQPINHHELISRVKKISELVNIERSIPVDLYDLLHHQLILEKSALGWSVTDDQASERSILEKSHGKSYYLQVDKQLKNLIAYIPVQSPLRPEQIWIVRMIYPLAKVEDVLKDSRATLLMIVFFVLITGLLMGRGLAKIIVTPIKSLNKATQRIMEGHLGGQVIISTGDEIETLAHTFNHMSESLMHMKAKAEDANPLTQLPGNKGIFDALKKRIHEKQKFVLFHADLDRFKAFNDSYGLARGDEVIKQTAVLLREAINTAGSKTDFVGHQGGDDFVVIVSQQKAKEVAEYVVKNFDEQIAKRFYRKEDYERGYILAVDRRAQLKEGDDLNDYQKAKIPLMGLSLAGVSNTKHDFADYFDCLARAVKVKSEVKKIPGSSYIIQE